MGSTPNRRRAVLLAAAATLAPLPARAQSPYPERPVRVIVGLQAGASTDTLARALARRLAERLGQQVIVENRPGAATRIGMEALARAPADGYTLAVANAVSTSFPLMFDGFEFVPGKDFAPVSMLGRAPSYLAVRATLPVRDAREFATYARANDGKIAFGQGGNGSNPHLAALTLLRSLGVRGVEVAYKGNAPAAVALAAGEIDFAMLDLASVRSMVEGGKVRLLAVTEPKRSALTPDVPTGGEQGLTREIDGMTPWFMLVAPAGTPAAIVSLLNRHVVEVMREPEVRQSLVASGIEPESGTPADAQAYFLKQREHVARLVGDLRVSLRQ